MQVRLAQAGAIVGAGLVAVMMTTPAGAATAEAGTGSAYAAQANVSLLSGVLGPHTLAVETGPLAASNTNGPTTASTVDATLKGLVSARVLTSSSQHNKGDGTVESEASATQVGLPVLRALAGSTPMASVISAQCKSTTAGITGSSDLADLDLGKIGHIAAATPNLNLGIPGVLQVIANEQIHHADGSLTVNALDIKLLGGKLLNAVGSGRIVISSVTCAAATTHITTPPSSTPTTAPTTTVPSAPAPSPSTLPTVSAVPTPPQVKVIPIGAPQTGDGSLATVVVR